MDKTIVNEVAATVATLRSSGETGFLILLLCLIAIIALAVAAMLYQRIVINRFESASKATQDHIKAIETNLKERELGVKEREEFNNNLLKHIDFLKSELSRNTEQQIGMESSIKATITVGLKDIQERLQKTTFKELMADVPENFKKDIQNEVDTVTSYAIRRIRDQVLDPNKYSDISETIALSVEKRIEQIIFRAYDSNSSVMSKIDVAISDAAYESCRGDFNLANQIRDGIRYRLRETIGFGRQF